MTDMHSNQHYEMGQLAIQRVETESGWYAGAGVDAGDAEAVARAQVKATLALAYEQRTANLIATFGQLLDGESDTFLGERIDGYELAKQIKERLGC